MTFLFRSGSLREKFRAIAQATYTHSRNLACFVFTYKGLQGIQQQIQGKQLQSHAFLAACVGGWLVFGENNNINSQINMYLLSRILFALSRLAMEKGYIPQPKRDPFPLFATLVWEFRFRNVHLKSTRNQLNHNTSGLISRTLVLRRGLTLQILSHTEAWRDHEKNRSVNSNGDRFQDAPVFKFKSFDLQSAKNQLNHKTNGLSSSTLVLRRGQAFQILVNFDGRAFDARKDKLVFQVVLGPLSFELPLSGTGLPASGSGLPGSGSGLSGSGLPASGSELPASGSGLPVSGSGFAVSGSGLPVSGSGQPVSGTGQPSTNRWSATLEGSTTPNSPRTISVSLLSPASASVGVYTLSLRVQTSMSVKTHSLGLFTLLCNPWCKGDSVFLSSEELRDEYVRSDIGLLFKGTSSNYVSRPWSYEQYEKGILDICMKLLELSPQCLANRRSDLLNRSNPVYIGRVISAMVNSQDDRGVLTGNWSGEYKGGVNPSTWSGSADILRKWSESQFRPVKYGQCWVFAAVMCTVMRALGIPTRAVTNFSSAHDTDGNMVIEEYYSELGQKLSLSKDSIWNFHVWVESWMKRPDLGQEYDGWQVLDPTPQETSGGMYRCGPAALKAILDKKVDAKYDVPFVYAEVNADVRTMIVRDGKVLSSTTDTKRVGDLICTKHPGSMRMLNITTQYKIERVPEGVVVSLSLLKTPVVGENIIFNVTVTNNESTHKELKAHINAQNKEYNSNPTTTFWEAHNDLKLGPKETQTFKHEILSSDYASKEVREDYLVNLAVVIEDVETQKRTLASQEFNIISPTLTIEIANENAVVVDKQQVATVTFTSTFSVPVNGELTVMGSGLLEEKVKIRLTLKPGEAMKRPVQFTPRMSGSKMLQASLVLTNLSSVLHGFKTINVKQD
ncbi:Protein-glutamine gamma-glutamyltransferase 5 [Triplophysa tibetana]|uniref:protein-glutamine gamma-glutamyltransferase n=1 Tax=Triplophysa tibetana TaxID=1572043 RepID=A0A5A9NWV6_9TELE|nr:Protein-glutamine gamma-glutamyltransferase 5 [Triplophysa tibetana]